MGFPDGSQDKESSYNAGDLGLMPGSGRSPGEGNGNPLQHSCLENSMERRAWWATYSPQGRKELDMSERLTLSISSSWTAVDPTYKQEKRQENGIREGDVVKEPE